MSLSHEERVSTPARSLYLSIMELFTPLMAEGAVGPAAEALSALLQEYPHSAEAPVRGALAPEPTLGLLVSMALRDDHSFMIDFDPAAGPLACGTTQQLRRAKMRDMAALHEEVVGSGFYSPEREDFYLAVIGLSTSDDDAERRSTFLTAEELFDYVITADAEGKTFVAECRQFPLLVYRADSWLKARMGIEMLVCDSTRAGVPPTLFPAKV